MKVPLFCKLSFITLIIYNRFYMSDVHKMNSYIVAKNLPSYSFIRLVINEKKRKSFCLRQNLIPRR